MCPFDRPENFSAARSYKEGRYRDLAGLVVGVKYLCDVVTLEVGSRGVCSSKGFDLLSEKLSDMSSISKGAIRTLVRKGKIELGRIALHCSFGIWSARHAPRWRPPPLFSLNSFSSSN